MTFIEPLTEEELAALAAREAEQRAEALAVLRGQFIADGVDEGCVDQILPTIDRLLNPRIDRSHGVLHGTMLTPLYGFRNPMPHDPEFPGWQDWQDREDTARAAARNYHAVRLSTGWIEGTP